MSRSRRPAGGPPDRRWAAPDATSPITTAAGALKLVRPGVVWFGEALPRRILESAAEAAASCDVLLTVGTSGLVYPAAEIPQVAARFGATVIQVNPEPTALDATSAVNLRGPAARVLPDLVRAVWGDDDG